MSLFMIRFRKGQRMKRSKRWLKFDLSWRQCMEHVVYYDDNRIDKYLDELSNRVAPLIKGAEIPLVLETLKRINEVRGFFTLSPVSQHSSETESLDWNSDEHNLLKKINRMSSELLFLIQEGSRKRELKPAEEKANKFFQSGLGSLQSAKQHPLSSLPNPEKYQVESLTDKKQRKSLLLEIKLDEEAEAIEQVPSIKDIENSLKAIRVASNFITDKCLKSKGRPTANPNIYLNAAVSELDACFKEYFPSYKGRKNGTPFQHVAFEVLCDDFFGSHNKEQIKTAIKYVSESSVDKNKIKI